MIMNSVYPILWIKARVNTGSKYTLAMMINSWCIILFHLQWEKLRYKKHSLMALTDQQNIWMSSKEGVWIYLTETWSWIIRIRKKMRIWVLTFITKCNKKPKSHKIQITNTTLVSRIAHTWKIRRIRVEVIDLMSTLTPLSGAYCCSLS